MLPNKHPPIHTPLTNRLQALLTWGGGGTVFCSGRFQYAAWTPTLLISLLPAGPADMGFSFGLHVAQDYDLPAMMASPQMQQIYGTVLEVGDTLVEPCLGLSSKPLTHTHHRTCLGPSLGGNGSFAVA